MKIALSYLVAVFLLLFVSINGQKIQEQHQSIENVNTANGHVSIDTIIERNRLFRRRLHRLNRRADLVEGVLPSAPVSGKEDVTTQPPTSTSDPTTTKSKASTSSHHQSTGSAIPPTVTSDGADKPSNIPSTSGSSSNKTGITIGVVVGAIVIAGAIGVWVFRKWKLSFKSKIRNSSGGFTRGVVGAGSVDHDEYDSYHDIFRPSAHDSAIPTSMPLVDSSVGSSPRQDHQQVSPQAQHMTQAQHMSMSSAAGTVPDYSQYRYTSSAQGYDSGIPQTVLGGNTVSGGVDYYHPQSEAYISQDYSMTGHANDQFLRELRE
ncbi:hypothetical protein BGZ81_010298 [Podila clonocystis]|nr:hypothetical protein BGZ81_010298 [Podila clonocystis]